MATLTDQERRQLRELLGKLDEGLLSGRALPLATGYQADHARPAHRNLENATENLRQAIHEADSAGLTVREWEMLRALHGHLRGAQRYRAIIHDVRTLDLFRQCDTMRTMRSINAKQISEQLGGSYLTLTDENETAA